MYLVYWKLELKRAYQRFPQMLAGAIALLFQGRLPFWQGVLCMGMRR